MRLEITFRGESAGVPLVWQDSDDESLEEQSSQIAISLLVAGEMQYRSGVEHHYQWLVKRKHARDEEERQRIEKLEREKRERQLKLEKSRRDRLIADAKALEQAGSIRRFLEAVVARAPKCMDEGFEERLGAWLIWAAAEADRIDPLSRPTGELIAYLFEVDGES